MPPLQPSDELARFFDRSTGALGAALDRLMRAVSRRAIGQDSNVEAATEAYAKALREAQREAAMRGARRTLIVADSYAPRVVAHRLDQPGFVPDVEPAGAIRDIVNREPRLAKTAAEVAHLYSDGAAFSAVRATSGIMLERVQAVVAESLASGLGMPTSTALIQMMTDWTRAYAATVLRTNVATAYTRGQFKQLEDPGVRMTIGALRFSATMDGDTRPNHAAANGLIAASDDPVWRVLMPPMGFNCRCSADFVPWLDLRRNGLLDTDGRVRRATVPPGAGPDAGFRR